MLGKCSATMVVLHAVCKNEQRALSVGANFIAQELKTLGAAGTTLQKELRISYKILDRLFPQVSASLPGLTGSA